MSVFKKKQDWLEAVMASDLAPAAKVFAFGVFTHMYGDKEEAFPGTVALEATTGQHRSKFPAYRKALFDAGFLTGDVVKGRKYTYRLSYMYLEGTSTCTQKVQDMYPIGTGHVPRSDTNTTSNTTRKTPMKDNKTLTVPKGPVVEDPSPLIREEYNYLGSLNTEDFEDFSLTRENLTFDYLANSEGVAVFDSLTTEDPQSAIKEGRWYPLTPGERKMFDSTADAHGATSEQAKEALDIVERTQRPFDIYEATTAALGAVGLDMEAAW